MVMSKQVSNINDRMRIGYGVKQRLIEVTHPPWGLSNNDEPSLNSRFHRMLVKVFFLRDNAHDIFDGIAVFKDILQIGRLITDHK